MKKRVLSALLALCLTLSLAGAAFAENEASGASSSAASQAVSSVEPESQAQDKTVSSSSASGEDQASAKTESTPAPTQTPAASDVTKEESESTAAPEATEEPEATAETDATPAPTEDPEAEVTEKTETDGSVEYTAALETDDQTLNVIVTAPEGAFAQDVQPELSVTMLTAEDELNDVANKLTDAEVQYDGFAALDITFTDKATGEEIEPVQQVSVRIELPQTIVDSGIDLNTLAVQHLEEDENGDVKNVTEVATLDNGITLSEEAAAAANEAAGVAPMSDMPAEEATAGDAAETPAAVAEFSVDGFSTFTLTWQKNYGGSYHFKITIHYVDENGTEIPGTNTINDSFDDGSIITFADYAGPIEGYTYQAAHYQSIDGAVITSMNAEQKWHDTIIGGYNTYEITFYKGNELVLTDNNSAGDMSDPKDRDIYLVYKQDSGSQGGGNQGDTGTVTENATVTTSKTAVLKTDNSGNYDLTLSISGDRGNKTKKQAVDVLFIVDRSGSMTKTRQNALDSAVETLITTLQSDRYKDNIDAQYGVVAFAGSKPYNGGSYYDYGTTSYNWTNDGNATLQWIKDLNFEGGTNYQQAIHTGKEMLENRSNDRKQNATTFVIFISDGIPTYRGVDVTNKSGDNKNGNGSDDDDGKNIDAAKTEIATMTCDYFYAIGMGDDFGQEQEEGHREWQNGHWVWVPGEMVDKQGTTNLKALANAVNADYAGDDHVYSANDEDLSDAFGDITATITFFAATDVTITDPLSQYADIVPNADGAAEFTVTVTRKALTDDDGKVTSEAKTWEETVTAGEEVEFQDRNGNNVTVTPAYDAITKTITLTFPHSTGETPGYELEPGYTYSIGTVITPSETAKELGMNNAAAQQTPDDNTGTHSIPDQDNNNGKDKGFWSNKNDNPDTEAVEGAKVTFKANGEDGAQAFPKPVIQVPEIKTADLTIIKDVQGIDTADLSTENGHTSIVNGQKFSFTVEKLDEDGKLDTDFAENDFVGGKKTVEITVDANGDGTTVLKDLPLGEYMVTESSYPQEFGDYTFDTKSGEATAILKDENGDSVTVINTYKHKDKVLTVNKQVLGDLAVKGDSFTFTLELQDSTGSTYTGEPLQDSRLTQVNISKYTFTLTGEEGANSIQITLPHGVKAKVTETDRSGYTTVESRLDTDAFGSVDNQTADMTSNHTMDFRNTKNVVEVPTGLERNDKPYALMIGVAVLAGMALAGGIVVRRRRRWME